MAITDKMLQEEVNNLNRLYGFKGREYNYSKKQKKNIIKGSGFELNYAYGGVSLVFAPKKTTGIKSVSARMTKPKLADYIRTMEVAIKYWKKRNTLK